MLLKADPKLSRQLALEGPELLWRDKAGRVDRVQHDDQGAVLVGWASRVGHSRGLRPYR